MRSKLILLASLAAMLAMAPSAAGSTVGPQAFVDVWTDKGEGEVYNHGEALDIYVESSFDAYVLVYTIDTDGYINVVFPYDCQDDGFLRGGRAYRIISGQDDGMYADGSKGVAYVRAVASATPIRRLYWPGCPGYERYAGQVTWSTFADYWGPALPAQIYGDPYIAMQSIDEFICWDSISSGAVSVGYTYYYVMEQVERPVYYVRTGWRWPHTWYWPCSGWYWNVCWDSCWRSSVNVCIGLGSYYPSWSSWGWSWCAPTWCAPSWCWPNWYRPCYASCAPRVTVCHTGKCGSCSKCTGSSCRTYPSQVKYKAGTYAGAGAVSARKAKSGDASKEMGLYTRADGTKSRSKSLTTDGDRDGKRRIKQVSGEAQKTSSDRGVKSKTSRKIYSTEGRKSAGKKATPVEIGEERSKPSSARSQKTSSKSKSTEGKTYRKAVSGKTSSSARTPAKKAASKSSSRSKVTSGSKTSNKTRSSSSSSSGSKSSHRGSPKARRSVSR